MATSTTLCKHDLIPESCSDCSGRDGSIQHGPPRTATARFHGRCAGCFGPIFPEDEIRPDGMGGWLGECCS